MPSAYIGDGYTESAVILATRRYPETKITFRPMRRAERDRLVTRGVRASNLGDLQVLEATQQVAASLAKHLVEWDVTHPVKNVDTGETQAELLKITAENMLGIEPNLFEKIYDIVAGFRDKEERDSEKLAEAERAAEKN